MKIPVSVVMSPPPLLLEEKQTVRQAAKLLLQNDLTAAPVVGSGGLYIGTLSLARVLAAVLRPDADSCPLKELAEYDGSLLLPPDSLIDINAFRADRLYVVCNQNKPTHIIAAENLLFYAKRKLSILEELESVCNDYETILNAHTDYITLTDGTGKLLWYNKSYDTDRNKLMASLLGKDVSQVEALGKFVPAATSKVLETGTQHIFIQQNRERTGDVIIVDSQPFFDNQGRIRRVATISKNFTRIVSQIEDLGSKTEIDRLYKQLAEIKTNRFGHVENITEFDAAASKEKKIIYSSQKMRDIVNLSEAVAAVDATVLLLGSSGVGKSIFAKFIHDRSPRSQKNFVKINCGAIPASLLESELFGYEAGAFTGANPSGKQGLVERAAGGTLFLDEVGELPLPLQVKLLQLIQEREYLKVGGIQVQQADIRIIAATNTDLAEMVRQGTFREDLYYRLNVISITIPSLKERKGDILDLTMYYLNFFNEKYKCKKVLASRTIDAMLNYSWPGNIRELENVIERLVITSDGNIITPGHLPAQLSESAVQEFLPYRFHDGEWGGKTLKDCIAAYEGSIIETAYKELGSTIKVAKLLGVDQSTVVRKLQRQKKARQEPEKK